MLGQNLNFKLTANNKQHMKKLFSSLIATLFSLGSFALNKYKSNL
jgi:hypothetical protein